VRKLCEASGKTVSSKTLRRIAKSAGMIWKRVRKSVRPRRDEKEFEKAKKEIAELERQQKKGEKDLYYFDEAGFDLQPAVPYAWQPKGETLEIPSCRSPRISVLGFLNPADSRFYCFTFQGSVNAETAAACFDRFSETLEKKAAVLIDNSPVHTSAAFTANIEKWEQKGLSVKYLPPYSPELNLIEILWRFIKYVWLPFSAFSSFENLADGLDSILRGIGSEYRIVFSSASD
jgi:hypothetical protein